MALPRIAVTEIRFVPPGSTPPHVVGLVLPQMPRFIAEYWTPDAFAPQIDILTVEVGQ